jgi:PKD repeat protein
MKSLYLPATAVSRPAVHLSVLALLASATACEKVALLAPTGSTVTISVSSTSVGSNGTAEVIATVIEAAGTPVHNGTEVRFQASVGRVEPAAARTESGVARAVFQANGASGTARILAFSGGAKSEEVEVRVGNAAAETITVSTSPTTVPQVGGTVEVIATVRDVSGSPLPGAQVVFATDNGTLATNTAVTDDRGEGRTRLTTNREANVRASVGAKEATARVTVFSFPTAAVTFNPANPLVGSPVTVTVTPSVPTGANAVQNVSVDLGDGTVRNLGAVTTAVSLQHTYTRADNYTVTATVVDSTGQRNSFATNVTVQQPVVGVSVSGPPTGDAGTAISFTVTVTNPNNINLSGVTVDFGNGNSATLPAAGGSAQTVYNTSGRFTVRATARDLSGNSFPSGTHVIEIRPRTALVVTLTAALSVPNAGAFDCTQTQPVFCQAVLSAFVPAPGGQPGIRVVFTATATGGFGAAAAASYTWDFNGDGIVDRTTNNASTDFLFTSSGTFIVRVRVTTTDGNFGDQYLTLQISP